MANFPGIRIFSATSHVLADEGSYHTISNPTPGTGLNTIAVQTTLADTAPFLLVKSGLKPVSFDYLRLVVIAPGTGGTSIRFAVRTDATKADPTGGTPLTPVNCNQGLPQAPLMTAFGGPLVAAAASGAVRTPVSTLLRPVIPVIGDVYLIRFGGDMSLGAAITTGAAQANVYIAAAPLEIGASQLAAFHLWLPGQSALSSYEVELGCWER